MPFTVLFGQKWGGIFPWLWPGKGGHIPWENVGKCGKMWEKMMLTRKNRGFHQDSSFSQAKMEMTSKRFHQETFKGIHQQIYEISAARIYRNCQQWKRDTKFNTKHVYLCVFAPKHVHLITKA